MTIIWMNKSQENYSNSLEIAISEWYYKNIWAATGIAAHNKVFEQGTPHGI